MATGEVPVLEVQTKRTTQGKTLRSRKIEGQNVSSTTQEVPRTGPFNLLGLPAELRNKIYEFCVSVTEYFTYDERDFCTCGQKHINDPSPERTCKYVVQDRSKFKPRLPGCYYPLAPDYVVTGGFDIPRLEHMQAVRTPRPNILAANHQLRNEALPIFYAMNDFVFEDCECAAVTQWICNAAQPEQRKHIRSISWEGPLRLASGNRDLNDHTFLHMASIIMLMQLNILGKCKVRLIPQQHEDIHFACILHDKISNLIQRKELTSADAENESSGLDELEVNGLIYCIARKLSDFLIHLIDRGALLEYRASGICGDSNWMSKCNCPGLQLGEKMSWIDRESLLTVGGSTQDRVVVID
jgi:hypothetical protein